MDMLHICANLSVLGWVCATYRYSKADFFFFGWVGISFQLGENFGYEFS